MRFKLKFKILVIVAAVALVGTTGTYLIGQKAKGYAVASWKRQAELDVTIATEQAQSWLAQSGTIMKGIAVSFFQGRLIDEEEFLRIATRCRRME